MSIDFGIETIRQANSLEREMLGSIRATILLPEGFPYLGRMGLQFRYGMADDFGTISITKKGLIIVDPVVMAEWGIGKSAGHIAHLWLHWLFDHARRAWELDTSEHNFYASIWNVAADCHCTDGMRSNYLAKQVVHLESHGSLGINKQTHVEATYFALLNRFIDKKIISEGGDPFLPDDFSVEDFMDDNASSNDYMKTRAKQTVEAKHEHLDNLDIDEEFAKMMGEATFEADSITDIPQEFFNSGIDPFRATHHYCGSGAGHIPLDMENLLEAMMGELGEPGMTELQSEALRDGVAEDIQNYFQQRGSTPAGLERFVNEQLRPPQVPWQARLRVTVQRPLLTRAGLKDFTFNRKRKNQIPGGLILPSMAGGEPGQCGVAIDTSGSMSEHDLALALAELGGILKHYDVVGYAVDAECHEIGDVFKVGQFSLKGGGGTDMRMAVTMAAQRMPKLTSLVIITDGDTPWPDSPSESNLNMQVVAAIVTSRDEDSQTFSDIPRWIDRVRIPATNQEY